ncbi:MAG: DUF4830 domain-containing protein [Oscillospiraceae bacterium]|nr:DUF4830 domain-containing protein [Oscillospiraceae bacterium]
MKNRCQKILFAAAALLLLLTAGLLLSRKKPGKQAENAIILLSPQMCEAWLNLRGWRVAAPEISQTRIPVSWQTDAGQRWLTLQLQQGFDPASYAGKAAERYVYPVLNAPGAYFRAELLLCDGVLVAASVYDASTQTMQAVR